MYTLRARLRGQFIQAYRWKHWLKLRPAIALTMWYYSFFDYSNAGYSNMRFLPISGPFEKAKQTTQPPALPFRPVIQNTHIYRSSQMESSWKTPQLPIRLRQYQHVRQGLVLLVGRLQVRDVRHILMNQMICSFIFSIMPNRKELSAARSPKRSQGFDRDITMRILVWIAKIAIAGLLKSWKSDD